MELPHISRADILLSLGKSMGPYPGVEIPSTPDEAVVVDAGDVLQGVGAGGLRRVRGVGLTC